MIRKVTKYLFKQYEKTFGAYPWIYYICGPGNFGRSLIGVLQRVLGLFNLSISRGSNLNDITRVASLLKPALDEKNLVRIGGPGDGGYLLPDDFQGIVACFSPGVADSASFELELATKGIPSYLADFSVDRAPVDNILFDFEKLFIDLETDGDRNIRLDDWIASKPVAIGDLILQMDIEGAEWKILFDSSLETLERFRIIVLELHDLDVLLTNRVGLGIAEQVLRKLRSLFVPVHIHPNNSCPLVYYQGLGIPPVVEITLLRRDRFKLDESITKQSIPHPLDDKNVAEYKDVVLPEVWWRH